MRLLEINILYDYNEYYNQNGYDLEMFQLNKYMIFKLKDINLKFHLYLFFQKIYFLILEKLSIDFSWKDDFKNDDLDSLISILLNKCFIFP